VAFLVNYICLLEVNNRNIYMGNKAEMLRVKDKAELLKVLDKLSFRVPRRDQGRKTEHAEKYSIYRFFEVMAQNDRIRYPLIIFKRERPDFEIWMPNLNVGVEHTEAVPGNKALEQFNETRLPEKDYWGRLYSPIEKKMKIDEIRGEILRHKGAACSFSGDEIERNWVDAMIAYINKKCETLRKNGFQRFEKTGC
jgi:hypothetical protein